MLRILSSKLRSQLIRFVVLFFLLLLSVQLFNVAFDLYLQTGENKVCLNNSEKVVIL